MTTHRELRPYQTLAVDAVEQDWSDGINRTSVILPTGAGKSTVIAKLASNAYRRGQPVALLAHRAELLDQMLNSVLQVDLGIPVADLGIVRARQNECHAPIVAASLQTLVNEKRLHQLGPRPVVLLDEAHHGAAKTYFNTLRNLGVFDGGYLCGFTATMNRDDEGDIGLGDLFQKVAYEKDLAWAIEQGFLVEPRGLTVHTDQLDGIARVRTVAGDYDKKRLAEIMEAAADCVTEAVLKHAKARRSIIFAASVAAAESMADMLTSHGHPTGVITGNMSYEKRQPTYESFRSGRLRAITTVGVLTEGADFPMCDCVVLARPTKSMNLYSQMIGRALRLHPGKTDALILDLTGQGQQVICLTDLAPGAPAADVNEDGTERQERAEGAGAAPAAPKRTGAVTVREFDLLPRSASKYRLTEGGYLFIDTRQERVSVFVTKAGAGWRVGHVNTRTGGVQLSDPVLPFDQAHAVAKAVAETKFGGLRAPNRSTQPASSKQVLFASGLGVEDAEGKTVAELSELIGVKLASRVLDQRLPKLFEQEAQRVTAVMEQIDREAVSGGVPADPRVMVDN